jgi:hypothetical protein
MFRLLIHEDARDDLARLWEETPEAAFCIGALLEELLGAA